MAGEPTLGRPIRGHLSWAWGWAAAAGPGGTDPEGPALVPWGQEGHGLKAPVSRLPAWGLMRRPWGHASTWRAGGAACTAAPQQVCVYGASSVQRGLGAVPGGPGQVGRWAGCRPPRLGSLPACVSCRPAQAPCGLESPAEKVSWKEGAASVLSL